MRKTTSQIAAQVLEKLATSRWREAIRSGELAPREAETLKTRMGVDPMREARGLSKGWRSIAKHHEFIPVTEEGMQPLNTFERMPKGNKRQVGIVEGYQPSRTVTPKQESSVLRRVRIARQKGMAGYVTEGNFKIPAHTYVPSRAGAEFDKRLSPKTQAELTGLVAGHEGSEMSALRRYKRSKFKDTPQYMKKMFGEWEITGHQSPRVILEEVRNARMLSPTARAVALRNLGSIERKSLAAEIPTIPKSDRMYLPKNKLNRYSDAIKAKGHPSNKILKTIKGLVRRIH